MILAEPIYHITSNEDWASAKKSGLYSFCALESEGFIHCSTKSQYLDIANSVFKGRTDLVLLEIDTNLLKPEVRYENLEGGNILFPHIYGALNLDAVVNALDLLPGADGVFTGL